MLKKLIEEGKIMEALAYPFYKTLSDGTTIADVKWKPDHAAPDGKGFICVPYLDGDQVRGRLNQVLGAKWQSRLTKHEDRTLCIISVFIDGEWVDREDVGTKTSIEKEKGETTDAIKRAAKNWGVGEYINDIPNVTLPLIRANGKNFPATLGANPIPLQGDDLSNYINTLSIQMSKLMDLWNAMTKEQRDSGGEFITNLKNIFKK